MQQSTLEKSVELHTIMIMETKSEYIPHRYEIIRALKTIYPVHEAISDLRRVDCVGREGANFTP